MKHLVIFLFFTCQLVQAQESKILERLQAIDNNGIIWYNVDGYTVTKENLAYDFDGKGLQKALKKRSIKDLSRVKDENIQANNLYFLTTEKLADKLFQQNSFYFLENQDKKITIISFAKTGEINKQTERELTNLILEDKIPIENFASMHTDTINFGGRKIALQNNCYWTSLNNVQCPYAGQMNWSVYQDLQDAKKSIENQLTLTKSRKGGKVISEDIVDVEFENVPTKAKKIVYDFKGVAGALVGMSGGKTLTIYYVAEEVRGNYMSCVLSFWNNDQINPETKLPGLLEKVMVLK